MQSDQYIPIDFDTVEQLTMLKYVVLVIISRNLVTDALTCADVLEIGDRKITMNELQTLQPKDMVQCLAHLGKEQLPKEEADFIWQSIITFHEGIVNVPDKVLMLLHWITPSVKPEDYANMTLSNIDVIQNFGLNYGLNDEQLSAIADRVREDYAGKEPEDYTYYDLTALRQILCAMNQSEIERIHPSAYKEAASIIGKLGNCKPEVLQGFANLALQPTAFGHPAQWSKSTILALGIVASHLPKNIVTRYKISTDTKV